MGETGDVNLLGIHCLVWAGGTTPAEIERMVTQSAAAGFGLLELSLHDMDNLDVDHARELLGEAGLQVSCSRGLAFDADVSSTDPAVVNRGSQLLQASLATTAALGGKVFTGAPYSALGKTGKCGKCQKALPTTAFPIDVSTQTALNQMKAASPIPVVVDFWSPSCGPCLIGLPRVEEAAAKSGGEYVMVRVNLESSPSAAAGYNVSAIPTMVRLQNGLEHGRSVGLHSTADMIKFAKTGI